MTEKVFLNVKPKTKNSRSIAFTTQLKLLNVQSQRNAHVVKTRTKRKRPENILTYFVINTILERSKIF